MHAYLWCFSVLFKIVRPISGESSTKLPIWGHHTQKHRFYGIKRWNTMRKKNLFLVTPIPPWSRWPSDSGKLRVTKNKWIFNFTIVRIFWPKKPLGGDPNNIHTYMCTHLNTTGTGVHVPGIDSAKLKAQFIVKNIYVPGISWKLKFFKTYYRYSTTPGYYVLHYYYYPVHVL